MGYVINDMPAPVERRLIDKLSGCETATIGHRRQMGFVSRQVQAVIPGLRIAGTAVTVALPGQDSTLLHHALGLLREGDVLVVDRLGDDTYACFGGGTAAAARAAGAAGAIIDGPCADFSEIRAHGFPVWCRGPAPVTTRGYDIGGAMNVPVCCGGVAVLPGYAVLADEGGVLVLPAAEVEAIAEWALDKIAGEPESHRRMLEEGLRIGELSGATQKVLAKRSDTF